jgi:hypothetical protein
MDHGASGTFKKTSRLQTALSNQASDKVSPSLTLRRQYRKSLLIAGHHSDLGQEHEHAGQILPDHLCQPQEIYTTLGLRFLYSNRNLHARLEAHWR